MVVYNSIFAYISLGVCLIFILFLGRKANFVMIVQDFFLFFYCSAPLFPCNIIFWGDLSHQNSSCSFKSTTILSSSPIVFFSCLSSLQFCPLYSLFHIFKFSCFLYIVIFNLCLNVCFNVQLHYFPPFCRWFLLLRQRSCVVWGDYVMNIDSNNNTQWKNNDNTQWKNNDKDNGKLRQ